MTELAEPDYGIWAGRTVREVMMQDAEAFQAWLEGAAPPAESHVLSCWRAAAAGWLNTSIFEVATVPLRLPPQSAPRSSTFSAPPLHSFARIDIHPLSIIELRSDGRRWHLCLLKGHINSE